MVLKTRAITRAVKGPADTLEHAGRQTWFYSQAYGHIPHTIRAYRKEILRLLSVITFGTGALAVIGGTIVIVGFITSFAGIELGLQGYGQLRDIGVEAFSGFVSAYLNTRVGGPVIAGIALVATVGAGFTAELGAMRISEEIDALEVMAVPSVPFLVTTRVIAGFIAIIPLYAIALLSAWAMTRVVVTVFFDQSSGAYTHYFESFLVSQDVLFSFLKVIIMAVVVMSIHCYYGFFASGGPAGVGRAVGSAVRLSLVAVLFTDLLLSLVLYAHSGTLNLSG